MEFDSLTEALEGLYDKSMDELPGALRDCIKCIVLPNLTHITSWDNLSPDDRHSAAMLWDYLQAPATKRDNEYWEDFTHRKEKITNEITKWEIVSALTASDLEKKEIRLDELRRQLALMEHKQENARVYHLFQDELKPESSAVFGNPDYIPYPNAYNLLADRLSATPAEIVAWVHMGSNEGGFDAYTDVNVLTPPKMFSFDYCKGEGDYLSHLMACWFLAKDITNFQPEDRFITSQQLIEHWGKQPGIQVEAFITAKISEESLRDYQPVMECEPQANNKYSLPIKTALFMWSDIALVDMRDFGNNLFDISKLNSDHYPANVLPHVINEVKFFVEDNLPLLRSTLVQKGTTSKQVDLVKGKILKFVEIQDFLSTMNNSTTKEKLFGLSEENDPGNDAATNFLPSAFAETIKLHFNVINKNEDANYSWWSNMMRNASDRKLTVCRVGKGKTGGGSLWRPDLIAVWLVSRHERQLAGMNKNAARTALKKFAGYEDIAEELFPRDE